MRKLHFELLINASKEKVWESIITDASYREWTKPFSPDSNESYFEGGWEKGSKIRFLSKDENGETMGMLAEIAENRKYEFISIKHIGMIMNGVEDTESEEVKKWTPAVENYTLSVVGGKTKVVVDLDTNEEYAEMFEEMWPKALEKLKEVSER